MCPRRTLCVMGLQRHWDEDFEDFMHKCCAVVSHLKCSISSRQLGGSIHLLMAFPFDITSMPKSFIAFFFSLFLSAILNLFSSSSHVFSCHLQEDCTVKPSVAELAGRFKGHPLPMPTANEEVGEAWGWNGNGNSSGPLSLPPSVSFHFFSILSQFFRPLLICRLENGHIWNSWWSKHGQLLYWHYSKSIVLHVTAWDCTYINSMQCMMPCLQYCTCASLQYPRKLKRLVLVLFRWDVWKRWCVLCVVMVCWSFPEVRFCGNVIWTVLKHVNLCGVF